MKIFFLPMLVLSVAFVSFRTIDVAASLPLCDVLKAAIRDEPAEFANLKGALATTNDDGSKDYALKISADGWPTNEYVKAADGSTSVDIRSESTTKEKASELFNKTANQIAGCLGIKGNVIQAEGVEQLLVFTKDKTDVGLMLITSKGKTFVLVSVSRES